MKLTTLGSVSLPEVVAVLPSSARVEKRDEGYKTQCWVWVGYTRNGYGSWGRQPVQYAHRVVAEAFLGPIPEGWEVDHLCFIRPCIRPSHLERVMQWQNRARANDKHQHRVEQRGRGQGTTYLYRRGTK
jgi:HNH endonuclease